MNRTWKFSISVCLYLVLSGAELTVGLFTHSKALQADAYHVFSDCFSFAVALIAEIMSRNNKPPKNFSFGYQKAKSLGAFFNGSWLSCLGVQFIGAAIERFIAVEEVSDPKIVFIMGCVALCFNVFSLVFLHEHGNHHHAPLTRIGDTEANGAISGHTSQTVIDYVAKSNDEKPIGVFKCNLRKANPIKKQHSHEHDHNLIGILLHILCDGVNNVAVIIASAVMWLTSSDSRFLADPIATICIAVILILSSYKLIVASAKQLLLTNPVNVNIANLRSELDAIDGVQDIHELHVWSLTQHKSVASVHVAILCKDEETRDTSITIVKKMGDVFHSHGVHSYTVQPEYVTGVEPCKTTDSSTNCNSKFACQSTCAGECKDLLCCCD